MSIAANELAQRLQFYLQALLGRHFKDRQTEMDMARAIIQDWTSSIVLLKFDQQRDVRYQVFRERERHFLEIRDPEDDSHIHTLELPDGMKLDRTSYEVLLRYVLLDVVAA